MGFLIQTHEIKHFDKANEA